MVRFEILKTSGKEWKMGKEVRLFKSEEKRSRSEVGAFLHELADKLTAGQVVLRQGKEELTLQVPQHTSLFSPIMHVENKMMPVRSNLKP